MVCVALAVVVAFLAQVNCQQVNYDTHIPHFHFQVQPVTVTETVAANQTVRVSTTSDVWISTVTQYTVRVTHLSTAYSYTPANADTVTSLVIVTSTPVSVVLETTCINPVRTAVSVFTSFITETERKDLYHTITHLYVNHEVNTIPVPTVQTLVQRVTSTTTLLTNIVVTSTTGYYH